jgi:hypothetical protein
VHKTSAQHVLKKSSVLLVLKISTEMLKKYLAGAEGLEPSHAGIKIQCLNQLGDAPTLVISRNHAIETA